ncbi:MAG: ABATE domain-containing protein [Pseudomonadota bacterium]
MALTITNIKRVGGSLALDFANSIDWRLSDQPYDWLRGYGDILAWARATGCITAAQKTTLGKLAKDRPSKAAAIYSKAIDLREAIDRIGRSVASDAPLVNGDLDTLNDALGQSPARTQLLRSRGGFHWFMPKTDLTTPLWPVCWSAADLFAGDDRNRIKVCAGEDCGWLFIDRSRNLARRWCSMSDCGNRDKARRFYARHKAPS